MNHPTIARVSDVSKRFVLHKDKSLKERLVNFAASRRHRDDFWALKDVNLDIEVGSTVGLVGHNGSGKSTLLKVIGGIIEPTTGMVERRGRLAALLELGAGFHPDLTGRENVYLNAAILGQSRAETARVFDEIVEFSGIEAFIDTQVKFYSSGMYVRLAFAVAIHVDPDLLLVDEVLAVGDEPFQRKCMDKIAQFQSEGRTILLVSHSAEQVGSLCDRVVVLHSGEIRYDGATERGIQILRAGYEDERRHQEQAHQSVTGEVPPYSIVEATAEAQESSGSLDVIVRVTVDIERPRDHWVLGLSIDNTLGMRLYGVTSLDLDVELPNAVGRHDIVVTLPDVRVGTGTYLLNVGVGDRFGQNYDRAPGAASFQTTAPTAGHGLLRINPRFASQSAKSPHA